MDKYLNPYSHTNSDGVKGCDEVMGVKSVNHVKIWNSSNFKTNYVFL